MTGDAELTHAMEALIRGHRLAPLELLQHRVERALLEENLGAVLGKELVGDEAGQRRSSG